MSFKIDAVFRTAQNAIEQEFNDFARVKAYEIQSIVKSLNAILGEGAISVQFYTGSNEENNAISYFWDSCVNSYEVQLESIDSFFSSLSENSTFDLTEGVNDLINKLFNAMKPFNEIAAPGFENNIEISESRIEISIKACINGHRY